MFSINSFSHIAVFIFSLIFSSCSGKAANKNEVTENEYADIIEQAVDIQRFDSIFYLSINNPDLRDNVKHTYPELLSALGSVTINKKDISDKAFYDGVSSYFQNDILLKIYKDALARFRDVSSYEKELSDANLLIKAKFEGKSLPNVAMHVSGFKANTLVTEKQISISIDKYLGLDYPAYQRFFEAYQRFQMQPKFVARDILKAWIIGEIPPLITPAKTLLEEMVYEGKILYALSELLPEWEKENLISYTSVEYEWCIGNESLIWKSIIEQKHLYNNEYFLNQKYISEAPYTSTISAKSPGRVGCWVGWQIVSAYAEQSGKSINEILRINDAQLILKGAMYNPVK